MIAPDVPLKNLRTPSEQAAPPLSAIALAQGGYVTDPSYSAKLNAIARAYKLDE